MAVTLVLFLLFLFLFFLLFFFSRCLSCHAESGGALVVFQGLWLVVFQGLWEVAPSSFCDVVFDQD